MSVVSYGAGRDAVPSRQARCNVLGRHGATLALDCDVTFGSSGAPVFRADGTDLRIVSIVAAGGSQSGQSLAFGPVLDGRIAELTARLRSGAGVWQDAPTTARRIEPGPARAAGGARFVRP